MKPFTLDRRTLLRGMAGTTLGLPLLDAMLHKRSYAQILTPPKRYIVVNGADLNPSIRTVDGAEKVADGLRRFGLTAGR